MLNELSMVCVVVSVFPELEEALGLKLHNESLENASIKRRVSVTILNVQIVSSPKHLRESIKPKIVSGPTL